MIRILIALAAALAAGNAKAADIAVALTDDVVEIDANFAGAQFTLFGAVTGAAEPSAELDIITVISGPPGGFDVRPLEQRGLFWIPGEALNIDDAPRFYATNATRLIDDIAPIPDQAQFTLGVQRIFAAQPDAAAPDADPAYRDAFLRSKQMVGLYRDYVGGVRFIKDGLFAVDVDLPANTPVGDYAINVFLYRDGALVDRDSATLQVNKVGIERQIYSLAHERPIIYGIICVAVSLLAGWIAGFAFRK